MQNVASIDIGSHTARLLICERTHGPKLFRPITRKRKYVRLSDGFASEGDRTITKEACKRALKACEEFVCAAKGHHADTVLAVSTGVTRWATNASALISGIRERTGLSVRVLSGAEEARISGKGVLHSLGMPREGFVIFDLGGGSIDFLAGDQEQSRTVSLPLGCALLTQSFFHSDPPEEKAIEALLRYVDEILKRAFGIVGPEEGKPPLLVGTGGTVASLATMVYQIGIEDIRPEQMDGLQLERRRIEALFGEMKMMTVSQRGLLEGLDRERAGVIPAGTAVVARVLDFFKASVMTVSLSDLLEGVLVEYLDA